MTDIKNLSDRELLENMFKTLILINNKVDKIGYKVYKDINPEGYDVMCPTNETEDGPYLLLENLGVQLKLIDRAISEMYCYDEDITQDSKSKNQS